MRNRRDEVPEATEPKAEHAECGVRNERARDALVALSAALATRSPDAIRGAMERAITEADGGAVEEALLQSHLFVGFPDALNALALWREISGRPAPPGPAGDAHVWEQRGEQVCATVYGDNYSKLRDNVAALHPDIDRWMVTGGYGRVIGRDGLDLATRELCLVALLAVWGVPRQLHSHLRGALNADATPAGIDRAIEIACEHLDTGEAAEARSLWATVRDQSGEMRM